ncbi:MAG: hypothetical protein SNJ74_10705 [Fimbriimonadaceae bacterium]
MVSRPIPALLAILTAAAAIVGCGSAKPEYKIEGPTASDNPSVGAPVGAAGAPVAEEGAEVSGAKTHSEGRPGR